MAGIGSPYANRLNIGVTLDTISDSIMCEKFAAAVTAAMVV